MAVDYLVVLARSNNADRFLKDQKLSPGMSLSLKGTNKGWIIPGMNI